MLNPFLLFVQVHPTVCDGYNDSLLINEIQELIGLCNTWLENKN
ncbi:hypothetical protein SAMN05421787_11031 [Virgibacillus pantothenticus]|nr:hypothetical protein SAMN05421787_11031 [Virgibacillus pantothenticus]